MPMGMGSSKATDAIGTAAPTCNFTVTTEARTRAAIAGPPAYMLRKRRIEDMEEALIARLTKLAGLAGASGGAHHGDDDAARAALARAARRLDLAPINSLIEKHNRYYPCEANLPMDPKTGALLDRGRPWTPLPPVTLQGLVERAMNR
jgi:hypothetical protein